MMRRADLLLERLKKRRRNHAAPKEEKIIKDHCVSSRGGTASQNSQAERERRRSFMRMKIASKRKRSSAAVSLSNSTTASGSSLEAKPPKKTFDCSALKEAVSGAAVSREESDTNTDTDSPRLHRPTKRIRTNDALFQQFYNHCPVLSQQQQVMAEYSLPIVLPCIFAFFRYTPFALTWVAFLIVGHTLETVLTDFGGSKAEYRLTSLQHHMCDCGWLHTLIHALLVMPHRFGPGANWMGIALIQTLPIYLSVSFKSHFVKQQKTEDQSEPQAVQDKEHWMGARLVQCFQWYSFATIILILAQRLADNPGTKTPLLLFGVLVFHAAPWIMYTSYQKKSYQHMGHGLDLC